MARLKKIKPQSEPSSESSDSPERNSSFQSRNPPIKATRKTKSKKAGLVMPVSRVLKDLRLGKYADIIQTGAAVYCSAVLEYLIAEVLELSGNAAHDNRKKRVTPRHITLAIRLDAELESLLKNVTIAEGGVVPFIHESLKAMKTVKKKQNLRQKLKEAAESTEMEESESSQEPEAGPSKATSDT